ncbi:MAG: hypothetical protein SPI59_05310 [Finegoldia sp.]|nr:hypothetical protein [Finegoldia sp.]
MTIQKVLEVLKKDINFKQIEDGRLVKYYNDIQVVYTDNGIEVLNAIARYPEWELKGALIEYSE